MEDEPPCNFTQLSDCLMLEILSYLDATSLYFLSQTCTYFENIIKDRKLWKYVDARSKPNLEEKLDYCIDRVHADTTHLLLRADSRKGKLLYPDSILRILSCNNLTVLSLENQRFCGKKVSLQDFPSALEELSLRKSHVRNGKSFFQHSFSSKPNLRVLILDECNWLDSSFIMSVAKFACLEIISIVKCNKLHYNIVPYLSVARQGCKKLKVLDCRFSTVGNDFLSTFNENENILALYFQSMRSYQQDYGKPLLRNTEKIESMSSDDMDLISQSIISNGSLYHHKFALGVDCNIEELPESLLYEDPYPPCTCKYREDRNNPEKNLSPLTWKLTKKVFGNEFYQHLCHQTGHSDPDESSNKNLMKVDDFMNFRSVAPQKFLCKKHSTEVDKLPREFKDFFVQNQLMFHAGQTDSDSGSDSDFDSDDCCMYGMGKAQQLILLRLNEMDAEGNLPEPEVIDLHAQNRMEVEIIRIDPFGSMRNEASAGRDRRQPSNDVIYQVRSPERTSADSTTTDRTPNRKNLDAAQNTSSIVVNNPSANEVDTSNSGTEVPSSSYDVPGTSGLSSFSTPSSTKVTSHHANSTESPSTNNTRSSKRDDETRPDTSSTISSPRTINNEPSSSKATIAPLFSSPNMSSTSGHRQITNKEGSTTFCRISDANNTIKIKLDPTNMPSTSRHSPQTKGDSCTGSDFNLSNLNQSTSIGSIVSDQNMPSTSANDPSSSKENSAESDINITGSNPSKSNSCPSTSRATIEPTISCPNMPSTSGISPNSNKKNSTVSSTGKSTLGIVQNIPSTSTNTEVRINSSTTNISSTSRDIPSSSKIISGTSSTSTNNSDQNTSSASGSTLTSVLSFNISASIPGFPEGLSSIEITLTRDVTDLERNNTETQNLNNKEPEVKGSAVMDNSKTVDVDVNAADAGENVGGDNKQSTFCDSRKGKKRSLNVSAIDYEPSTSQGSSSKRMKLEKDNNVTSSDDNLNRNYETEESRVEENDLVGENAESREQALPDLQNVNPPPALAPRMLGHILAAADNDQDFANINVGLHQFLVRLAEVEEHKKKKLKLRRLSLRGYRKITDTALNYIKNLKIDLLDLTYTNVTKRGIEQFLSYNPNCRVIHKDFCVCKPRIPS